VRVGCNLQQINSVTGSGFFTVKAYLRTSISPRSAQIANQFLWRTLRRHWNLAFYRVAYLLDARNLSALAIGSRFFHIGAAAVISRKFPLPISRLCRLYHSWDSPVARTLCFEDNQYTSSAINPFKKPVFSPVLTEDNIPVSFTGKIVGALCF